MIPQSVKELAYPYEVMPYMGVEGWYVTENGDVISIVKGQWGLDIDKPKVLKPTMNSSGYKRISTRNGEHKVHRIVALTFLGQPPDGYECRHLDGDRTNNHISNLAWGTRSDNQQDSIGHGTHVKFKNSGEGNGRAILTTTDVIEIRQKLASGSTTKRLGIEYGVSRATIDAIKHRKLWKDV